MKKLLCLALLVSSGLSAAVTYENVKTEMNNLSRHIAMKYDRLTGIGMATVVVMNSTPQDLLDGLKGIKKAFDLYSEAAR